MKRETPRAIYRENLMTLSLGAVVPFEKVRPISPLNSFKFNGFDQKVSANKRSVFPLPVIGFDLHKVRTFIHGAALHKHI